MYTQLDPDLALEQSSCVLECELQYFSVALEGVESLYGLEKIFLFYGVLKSELQWASALEMFSESHGGLRDEIGLFVDVKKVLLPYCDPEAVLRLPVELNKGVPL